MDKPFVVAIILARMGSSRFPGKVLSLINGKYTVLDTLIARLQQSEWIDKVVVATSERNENDVLVQHCKSKGYEYMRGSEDDLIHRMFVAADHFNADIIVDITADCPLIDATLVEAVLRPLIEQKLDYCSNVVERTFPDGLDVQAYTWSAFTRMIGQMGEDFKINSEHTGINFIKNKEHFKIKNIEVSDVYPLNTKEFKHPEWELTVDYPEDLDLLQILFGWNIDMLQFKYGQSIEIGPEVISARTILHLLSEYPKLLQINSSLPRRAESNPKAEVIG